MRLLRRSRLRRLAASALLSVMVLACQFLTGAEKDPVTPAPQAAGPPSASPIPPATVTSTTKLHSQEAPRTESAASLAVHDSYPLDTASAVVRVSVTTSPGKVRVGTGKRTVEDFDAQTGALLKSILLKRGGPPGSFVLQLAYDGQVIAAFEQLITGESPRSYLFLIDSGSGSVVHEWDRQSQEWNDGSSGSEVEAFGVSPGKIWLQGRMMTRQRSRAQPACTSAGTHGSLTTALAGCG